MEPSTSYSRLNIGSIYRKHQVYLLYPALLAVAPLLAHHSFAAEFDTTKAIRLEGSLTKIEWTKSAFVFLRRREGQRWKSAELGL
jgi:hypothetical protein